MSNIGGKIKTLVVVVAVFGLIACLLLLSTGVSASLSISLAVAILVAALPLYGFGVLVEGSEERTAMLTQSLEEQKKTNEYLRMLLEINEEGDNKSAPKGKKNVSSYLPEL